MHLNLVKKSFYFSLIIFLSSFTFLLVSRYAPPTDKACDRRRIIFSPLQDVISYKWVNYGDYFFPRSVYRTPVTRPIALDTQLAWQDLVKDFEISIPEQKLVALKQSTDYQWKRHPDGGIAANVAVFHQLSCLSTIRLHTQADLNDPWRQESRERVDQCLELLRHKFMCDADATPFLLKNNPHVIRGDSPDMGTKHKCRNYNAVVSWLNQNARQN